MSLSSNESYNLVYLMEEGSEVIQAASKILRFGPEVLRKNKKESNAELLEEELGDFLCIMDRLIDSGIIDAEAIEDHRKAKAKKLYDWEEANRANKNKG